jgi:hypothetical protein
MPLLLAPATRKDVIPVSPRRPLDGPDTETVEVWHIRITVQRQRKGANRNENSKNTRLGSSHDRIRRYERAIELQWA